MSIIWMDEKEQSKRCYKVYRSGQYMGTALLTEQQVKDFRALPVYEVRPVYWVSESR